MERIKALLKSSKRDIIIGIVVFVLTSSLSALYHAIKNSAPEVAMSVLGLFRGIIYTSAAKQRSDSLLSLLISIGIGIGLSTFIMMVAKSLQLANKEIKRNKMRVDKLGQPSQEKQETLSSSSIEMKGDPEETKIALARKLKKITVGMIVLVVLAFFIFILICFLPNSLWNTFENDLTMIAPYSDSKTILTLQSDWVQMRTKEDYQAIYNTINEIKKSNSLP